MLNTASITNPFLFLGLGEDCRSGSGKIVGAKVEENCFKIVSSESDRVMAPMNSQQQ